MAIKTISNTGGNFNTTGAWTDGILPVAGDSVVATATSGPLTISAATVSIVSANFTNYTSTLTINNTFNVTTTVVFVSGMTIAGTSGTLTISPTTGASLTSGGKTLTCGLTTTGTSQTYTLVDSWTVDGTVTLQGTSSQIINGNTLFCKSNLTVNGLSQSGTTTIVLSGTGTWSSDFTSRILQNSLTINTTGTITISGTVNYNTGTLTFTAGTVIATGSTLAIAASTTFNTNGITWNNVTISATATVTLSSNLTWSGTFSITGGNTTFAGAGVMSGAALSITTSAGTVILNNDITCTGLVTLGAPSAGCTLSGSSGIKRIITSGGITNLTTSSFITCNISIQVTGGTITSASSVPTGGYYTINTGYQFEIAGNVTIAATGAFYIYGGVATGTGGTFKHTSGTVTTTGSTVWLHSMYINSGTITWNNMWILSGGPTTTVLQSDMTVNGLLTLGYLTVGYTINNDGTTRTIIANGGITMSGSTSAVVGTANIRVTGGTITGVSTVQLRNNLELTGNITFATGVTFYYNTGTILYTSGVITTSNSTLSIGASTTLNTTGITWNNVTISATSTVTLSSNLAWSGTFSITGGNTTFAGVGVMSGASLTITTPGGLVTLNANITCTGLVTLGAVSSVTTLSSSGGTRTIITSGGITNTTITGNIVCNINIKVTSGTITASATSPANGGYYQVNTGYQFEIDGNVTFASTGAFYIYGGVSIGTGGSFKHTSGTVTTTGSSVWFHTSLYIDSGTITWNNVWFLSGASSTAVLQSDVTVNGLLTLGYLTAGFYINNDGTTRTIIANAGITLSGSTSAVVGTANIKATGGTITGVSTVQLRNNLELAGNVTFASGVTFYYNTGTILYTSGTITTTNSTINIGAATTLNTGIMAWGNVTISGSTTFVITLTSDFNIAGTFTILSGSTLSFTLSGGLLKTSGDFVIGGSGNGPVIFNVPNDITVNNLSTVSQVSTSTYTLNSNNISISGSLTIDMYSTAYSLLGTTNLILTGNGTISCLSGGSLKSNLTINTGGRIKIGTNFVYSVGTLTYLAGNVVAKNSTLSLGTSTLINCHRVNFDRIAITSASIITMNEFFSGSPGLKTTITPSSITNYTITFQDRTEKFSRFIKINRATLSNPGQLTVITDRGNQLNNVGIRFAPNQRPNGVSKNNPTIKPYQVSGLTPTQLLADPALS